MLGTDADGSAPATGIHTIWPRVETDLRLLHIQAPLLSLDLRGTRREIEDCRYISYIVYRIYTYNPKGDS